MSRPKCNTVDVFDMGCSTHRANVATLHLENHAAAQVSALPDNDGFLIRVWGPDRLHEYGGDNGNTLSVTVRIVDGRAVVSDLWLTDVPARASAVSPGTKP